jgi:hypothetical protein
LREFKANPIYISFDFRGFFCFEFASKGEVVSFLTPKNPAGVAAVMCASVIVYVSFGYFEGGGRFLQS